MHCSLPNNSKDRCIGLNAQYLAAHVSQTKHYIDSAILVRGRDICNHFMQDMPAEMDLDLEDPLDLELPDLEPEPELELDYNAFFLG